MTKYTLIGILSCIGGGVLIGFQMLSSVMRSKSFSKSLSLVDLIGEQFVEWVGSLPVSGLERTVETIVNLPLFVILFCVGGLFFVLDYFLGRR